ncbi:MAG: response regulator [Planctomycetes bacterium]|nr:response regulator [Planctomycetota bacterium]
MERSLFKKNVFTTGDVAEICNISQQTVIRCFDNGRLKGFRVPGSKFRRIPRESLIQFMQENSIPLEQIDAGKKCVLVVDDEPEIVELIVEWLERDGRFDVVTASTGFDAGLRTKEHHPDAIILDYLLPDINGNAVVKSIRSDPELADVKIIIVSGIVNREEVEGLLQTGANDFIKKPFIISDLVKRIAELVGV